MKKQKIPLLVLFTCIFAAFIVGFFCGRSMNRAPVRVSYLPTVTEAAGTETPSETVFSGIVNINTATAEELQTLPGIGPVLAQRIIDYRTQNGSFHAPEELTNVKGIGTSRLEAILDLITTGG